MIRSRAANELVQLAARLSIPVVTSWGRKDAFPIHHGLAIGMMGNHASPATRAVVREADVILAVGTRFSEFSTSRWRDINRSANLIHVDIDPQEMGKIFLPTVAIVSDAGEALKAMLEELEEIKPKEFNLGSRQERCKQLREAFLKESAFPETPLQENGGVSSLAVIHSLEKVVSPEDVMLVHSVTFEKWFLSYSPMRVNPGAFHLATGGTLGWGLPAAMGLQVGLPGKRVVAVIGDGGYLMNVQELETAVREKIPVKVLVMNNFCYGNIRSRQMEEFGGRLIGSLYGNPDFAKMANSFGIYGRRVERDDDVLPAILESLAQVGPAVVDIIQSADEGLPEGTKPQLAR